MWRAPRCQTESRCPAGAEFAVILTKTFKEVGTTASGWLCWALPSYEMDPSGVSP
jgi:hypothetical protein